MSEVLLRKDLVSDVEKCDNCEITQSVKKSKEPACCLWYMENVVCGDKCVKDCKDYKPSYPDDYGRCRDEH